MIIFKNILTMSFTIFSKFLSPVRNQMEDNDYSRFIDITFVCHSITVGYPVNKYIRSRSKIGTLNNRNRNFHTYVGYTA